MTHFVMLQSTPGTTRFSIQLSFNRFAVLRTQSAKINRDWYKLLTYEALCIEEQVGTVIVLSFYALEKPPICELGQIVHVDIAVTGEIVSATGAAICCLPV